MRQNKFHTTQHATQPTQHGQTNGRLWSPFGQLCCEFGEEAFLHDGLEVHPVVGDVVAHKGDQGKGLYHFLPQPLSEVVIRSDDGGA